MPMINSAQETKINLTLSDALLTLISAQDQLRKINALGMADDLRRQIRDLEDMINWSGDHQGWASADPS